MDNSIFYSLGLGAKFNKTKFQKDINLFKGNKLMDLDKNQQNTTLSFFKKDENKEKQQSNENKKNNKPTESTTNQTKKEVKDNKKKRPFEEVEKEEEVEEKVEDQEEEEVEDDDEENDKEGDDYVEDQSDNEEEDDDNEEENINLFKKKYVPPEEYLEDDDEEEEEEEEEEQQQPQKNLRNRMRIKVKGTDIPEPIENFKELDGAPYNLKNYLSRNIASMGYSQPSPIQMQAIPTILKEREVIACAPTGSGKTAAFTIPILHTLNRPQKVGFRAVIISPTRELAQQIYRQFRLFSKGKPFRICVLTKGLSNSSSEPFAKTFDILITTPLRLVHLIKEDHVNLNRVEHLVFDEADKLFDQQFVEQVDGVVNACKNKKLKISLFSATMNNLVEDMARSIMSNPIKIVIGQENSASTHVDQKLIFVGKEEGKLLAIRQLFQKGLEPPILIFVQSKERAQELFQELIFDNINVDVIHSDRTQFQRDKIVEKFRTGKIWVLICTELMARGMDFKGVNYVINFDFPKTVASYVHRIGRTGRAGRDGVAYTLYTESDAPMIPSIANVMKNSGSDVPDWMSSIKVTKKDKQNYKKRGVERESISTIPKSERWKLIKKKPKKSYDNEQNQKQQNNNEKNNKTNNNNNNNFKNKNNNQQKQQQPKQQPKQQQSKQQQSKQQSPKQQQSKQPFKKQKK